LAVLRIFHLIEQTKCQMATPSQVDTLAQLALSNACLGMLILLQMLDVFVPPAALPSAAEHVYTDRLGSNSFLSWVWARSPSEQFMLAVMTALLLWWLILILMKLTTRGGEARAWAGTWNVAGCIIGLSGWGLRRWAKRTLAALFTYQISAPTTLVASGPYSLLLHPGYTGNMLHICGAAILAAKTMEPQAGVACVVLLSSLTVGALLVRIVDEEAMLLAHLGSQWSAHAADRWHLVPVVW
jgi:protein-S-isoprenylcysteine O-methyltransferase Ste14